MYHKDRSKNGGERLVYVNKNLPGNITSAYKFKENSELIVLESSVPNKKWLLLGNYKLLLQNDLLTLMALLPNLSEKQYCLYQVQT